MAAQDDARIAFSAQGVKESIMIQLQEQKKSTSTEISNSLNIPLNTAKVTLTRLKKLGIVEKVGQDAGGDVVTLTEQGRRVIDSFVDSWLRRNEILSMPHDPSEITELLDQADRVIQHAIKYGDVLRTIRHNPRYITLPWKFILEHVDLSEECQENPDHAISLFREALSRQNIPTVSEKPWEEEVKRVDILVEGLSDGSLVRLSELRHVHVDRLWSVEALVAQMTGTHPRVKLAKFECPSCGAIWPVSQPDVVLKSMDRCTCGRKRLKRVSPESEVWTDTRVLVLEEPTENVENQMQPTRMKCFVNGVQATLGSARTYPPGSRVRVTVVPRLVEETDKNRRKSSMYGMNVESVYIEPTEKDEIDLEITKEDAQRIEELASRVTRDGPGVLIESFSPYVTGLDYVKDALLLMACSGKNGQVPHSQKTERNVIHILVIGDPGTAKTTLSKGLLDLVSRSRFAMGANQSSGAGLIAAVQKDSIFGNGWMIEAGQVVLADGSICVVDEFEKMREEDVAMFHEALEEQKVTIAKATVKQTLRCWTGILALGNPRGSRFDVHKNVAEQIDIVGSILSRFDLIIPLYDSPDALRDRRIVESITKRKKHSESGSFVDVPVERELLRKYISFVRSQPNPSFSDGSLKILEDFFCQMRGLSREGNVTITPRSVESVHRLAMACARRRLSRVVEACDATHAVDLYTRVMRPVLTDVDTGVLTESIVDNPRDPYVLVRRAFADAGGGDRVYVDALRKSTGLSEGDIMRVLKELSVKGDIVTSDSEGRWWVKAV